ncbi:disease resistance protein Pik-2 isoform X2 [Triticum aestivum]|uniref:disease resistance protein Pik-2 isoform X2 n=1 Tax=Triticum aestivum TaxID=4565 RepID=UPI0008444F54|nr:disease resistance protein Pik-2-like isoform X2 [Triticum aestivum]
MEAAMIPLIKKLGGLLADEYNLETRVRKGVESLIIELEMMHAVLRKIGDKPPEQFDEQVLIWAGKVRDLSYRMEDAVDSFVVRVEDDGHDRGSTNMKNRVKKFLKRATKLFTKGKALHQISDDIEEAQRLAKELGDLRQRYMIDAHASANGDAIDPRLKAVYKDVTELVGIDHIRDGLIENLCGCDERSKDQLRTMSIVGFGGLGKTTLAKAVYDKIKVQFHSRAFVSVSRNPDMTKIFKKILYELDKSKYATINEAARDNEQLIDEMRMFLQDKRYLIVIDDIWDEEAWEFIKCAFSDNCLGSRVMTTTRIGSISKACCSSGEDIIYHMKRLTDDDSRKLFYKRIFPQGSKCPAELEPVSREILKKCGGVPLAIITIASILANNGQDQWIKPKYHWDNILGSIGRGLAEGGSANDMHRILSFSYYDLPSHLKACLLYLSIFPEDFEIRRKRLIWMWIAEGLVQDGKKQTGLFELGESYFNELANRNLIQPIHVDDTGKAKACRVHDMLLDLLCSLSSEVNFVTILDGTQQSKHISHNKSRRLSFQNSMSKLTTHGVDATSFHVLRVLDLEGCDLRKNRQHIDLRYVENLLHLRYLGLRKTFLGELPVEIGKLKYLETLDLAENGSSVATIPSSVVCLRRLMFLDAGKAVLPVGIGNLTSLEELTGKLVDMKELGQLVKLRVLYLYWNGDDESMCNSLQLSLGKLQKMQSLTIFNVGDARSDVSWDGWVPTPQLRYLLFRCCTTTLPRWVNSSSFPLLSSMSISVDRIRPEVDIQILGTLPALCLLWLLTSKHQHTCVKTFVVGANAFRCLRECSFFGFLTGPSMFPRGAMPRLEFLMFSARASDIVGGDLDVSMGHLPFLRHVMVYLWLEEGSSLDKFKEEADVVLRHALDIHPNRPTLETYKDAFYNQ